MQPLVRSALLATRSFRHRFTTAGYIRAPSVSACVARSRAIWHFAPQSQLPDNRRNMSDTAPTDSADPFAALIPLVEPYLANAQDPMTITADDPRYQLLLKKHDWKPVQGQPQTYIRATIGSEQVWALIKVLLGEMLDAAIGASLHTTLDKETLHDRLLEGVMRMRYHSPLVAASLKRDSEVSLDQHWSYTCASSPAEVEEWARQVLHVVDDPITMEEFSHVAARQLPETHEDGHESLFGVYLLTNVYPGENKMAIFVHGAHCLMDGHSGLDCLAQLLSYVVTPEKTLPAAQLAWGKEWWNLPPAPFDALGGLPESFKTEGLALVKECWALSKKDVTRHGLKPQRITPITAKPEYVVRVIDEATTSKLLARLKEVKSSPTTLIDAAKALAELRLNPIPDEERDSVYFRYGIEVSLRRYLKCDPRTYITSCLTFISNELPVSSIPTTGTEKDRFIAVMNAIQKQYVYWASQPLLPFIGAAQTILEHPILMFMTQMASNPYVGLHSSVGLIESILPTTWVDKTGKEVIQIDDIKFGHRKAGPPPAVVSFTVHGKMHIQVMYGDHWNTAFIDQYLDEIERNMRLILDDSNSAAGLSAHL
ncbi:hypothetical protein DACRYDRAFT_22416 [Dacryopinax primogenitus]|uniref:CoA-dependent acyltransferase n=1 Tax=Dacryopinax primogenitus (strain DJM 731) TaxID=1858805 RepID=M5GCX1_DACPD|nr:uncharacterized protein DACRYDRAFT_22416 [Dacryopinax primogenitus]EJU02023.1 hypothetical protein DACRYDRAFT_22416 [Dacryopinax primogenitus]